MIVKQVGCRLLGLNYLFARDANFLNSDSHSTLPDDLVKKESSAGEYHSQEQFSRNNKSGS